MWVLAAASTSDQLRGHLSFRDQIILRVKSLEIWTSEVLWVSLACTDWANEAKQEVL